MTDDDTASKWRAAGQQHPAAPDIPRSHTGVLSFSPCATAHASPGWSSRHRRPTHGGAGQAPRVKVERPTGRTTLTRGAWSARLCLGRWRRDGQASTPTTRQPRPGGRRPSRSPRSPPEVNRSKWARRAQHAESVESAQRAESAQHAQHAESAENAQCAESAELPSMVISTARYGEYVQRRGRSRRANAGSGQ